MEPAEALSTTAQIAATLAGFAGVVVVFRRESVHDWSAMDKLRLRFLLANSLLPLAFCMVGMLFLTIKPTPLWIWRGASGFALVCLGAFATTMSRSSSVAVRFTGPSRFVFYPFLALGFMISLFQLYNIAVLNVFWGFYLLVVFQLLTATVQFVRIIILPPEDRS
jgi:hypothetical protein